MPDVRPRQASLAMARRGGPVFLRVLGAELYKMAVGPRFWFLLAVVSAILCLFSVPVSGTTGVQSAVIPAGMVGALLTGEDYSHGSTVTTLSAVPGRARLLLAKMTASALAVGSVAGGTLLLVQWVAGPFVDAGLEPMAGSGVAVMIFGTVTALVLTNLVRAGLGVFMRSAVRAVVLWSVFILGIQPVGWLLLQSSMLLDYLPHSVLILLMGSDAMPASGVLSQLWARYVLALSWAALVVVSALRKARTVAV
ncbi:hypothetical protein [uncultured Propionibacterium sp.]|uniref:hypothetical protein n=1 Tax=uncultured Propionibacterium sp. TaxID=218066 RepID=UPI0029316E2E|nr:hypothetical protein [uncultured Propionibacterium sp.]